MAREALIEAHAPFSSVIEVVRGFAGEPAARGDGTARFDNPEGVFVYVTDDTETDGSVSVVVTATGPDAVDTIARWVFDRITVGSRWRAVLFDVNDNPVST